MKHLPYDICLRLRAAGLPQPEIENGQKWFLKTHKSKAIYLFYADKIDVPRAVSGLYCKLFNEFCSVEIDVDNWMIFAQDGTCLKEKITSFEMIFCPDAEYLLDHLPDTLKIEKYNKQWMLMVKGEYQLKDTLLEAAAHAYLHLHENTPAP